MKFLHLNSRRFSKTILLIAAILLMALSFFSASYFQSLPSVAIEQNSLSHYVQRHQNDFNRLIKDAALMNKMVRQELAPEEFEKVLEKEYGVFLFAETVSGNPAIVYWNNQKILPPTADFSLPDGEYFQKLANGYYVTIKKTLQLNSVSSNIIAYAMIPILSEFNAESSYFYTHFVHSKDANKKIVLSQKPTRYPIFSINKKELFFIDRKAQNLISDHDVITIVLRLAAIILLLVYVHFVAESITQRKGIIRGLFFLIFALLLLRTITYFGSELFNFRQFQLFDPVIYGSNAFNKSLGDLLLNSFAFCWLVVFAWFHIGAHQRLPIFLRGWRLVAAGLIAVFILIATTFSFANIISSLVKDSKISFYVTNFFSLDLYTVVGFVVLALLTVTYYFFSRLLFRIIFPAFPNIIYVYFLLAVVGLTALSLVSNHKTVLFYLPVLVWLILYTLILSQERFLINRFKITVAGILFWIFVFSVSLAAVILEQNREKEYSDRKSFAEKQADLTDPSGQRTLTTSLIQLDNRFLVNHFHQFVDPVENEMIRDSILRSIRQEYSNEYITRLYVFDSAGNAVNNREPITYGSLNNTYTLRSKYTGIQDLYYHEPSFDQFIYIIKREIKDTTGPLGSIFITSTFRQKNNDALYLELLKQIDRDDAEKEKAYSYAIYDSTKTQQIILTNASGKYAFPTRLLSEEIPKLEYVTKVNGKYDELWYKAAGKKIVVVAKKRDTLIESITLFSYLFCSFIFMITLLQAISLILKVGSDWSIMQSFWMFNIRSQVHGTIIFISLLSFLIIGVATISFFIDRYYINSVERLSRTSRVMLEEMKKNVLISVTDSSSITNDSLAAAHLQKLVNDISDIHNVDVNLYDLSGNLEVSSNTEIYDNGILSRKIHPKAFYHLNDLRKVEHVQEETMSTLKYLSIYAPVRDINGITYRYLNIPSYNSQAELKQEISNYLVTVINLNAFIFLIAGTLAVFITNKITRSFSVIGDKMKAITLGKTNEEIQWKQNDEIGELVKQYNKMVQQLEDSANALAKSEREGAWREMARQVAHEIKNPLTPMKLSIQYLQKAITNNQSNVKELTTNVAETLIEQIDHLSKIAADFGRFANIGNANLETFDLHGVLDSLRDLFNSNPKVQIRWQKVNEEVLLNADKTHMNRLFTNLLTNAIDACEEKETCQLEIIETLKENNVLIQVKDNGEGIPEEMQEKIFTPNFTTKTSGTGLGLAICKSIVEQAGGHIWFTTARGEGTTFFVELPLINN